MNNSSIDAPFFRNAINLVRSARNKISRQINLTMVQTYFDIGRMIVENEQSGSERAEYGKQLLVKLSEVLTIEFGSGFSETNLRQMRKFFLIYEKQQTLSAEFKNTVLTTPTEENTLSKDTQKRIQQTVSAEFKLSWSHYLKLMRIDNSMERNFYEIESIKNNWSVRELNRNYASSLFTRLALSRNEKELIELSEKGHTIENAGDIVKDPYILEFLGLDKLEVYTESDLEERIITKLEQFLMELGNGFTFVSRQKRISFDEKHFYIDLVFYNRMLRSFVLIDLKIGEIKHQDIGQMQMYVHYYDREVKLSEENKTIGIILCQNKSEALVRYTLPEDNKQIFASKYETILPSQDEFLAIINS